MNRRAVRNLQKALNHLLIDYKAVLKDCKNQKINMALVWSDYQKTYEILPHSYIPETKDLSEVSNNAVRLMLKSMRTKQLEYSKVN